MGCLCLGAPGQGSAKGLSPLMLSPACASLARSLQLLFAGMFISLSERGASPRSGAARGITANASLCSWAACGPPSPKHQTQNAS